MKRNSGFFLLFCCLLFSAPVKAVNATGDSIQATVLSEGQVKRLMAEMLTDHVTYAESIYTAEAEGGFFGTGNSNESGVRTTADYALLYAFLYTKLPAASFAGIPRSMIREKSVRALKTGYLNHVSGPAQYLCRDGKKWGHHWQSSYWAAAYGLALWLLWEHNKVEPGTLDQNTYDGVKKMLLDEADFSISNDPSREVKANEYSDTKAEENAWNTQILALTKSLFPLEKNAALWDDKMKSFAMNSYGTAADRKSNVLIDGKPAAVWTAGPNVHPDYTLENHGIFHPWYQSCVLTLLTESALFYKKAAVPVPQALSHNVMNTWNEVIKKILVADGEFAYPNGCDWAMHVYSTGLAAVSSLATYYQDVDARFFESRLVQYQRRRQLLTGNGKFVTDPAVDQERNGVIAHALVFSYLMHDSWGVSPSITSWNQFEQQQKETKLFPYSKVIRGMNQSAYTAFSWANYFMGTFMPRSEGYLNEPNVTFPFRKGSIGNMTGYFSIAGRSNKALLRQSTYSMKKDAYATAGCIEENLYQDPVTKALGKPALEHYIAFAQTPGNAVVYLDKVRAIDSVTINEERGLSMGILTDPVGGNKRHLYYDGGEKIADGRSVTEIPGNWVNIDAKMALVMTGKYSIKFGNRQATNSVDVSRLYGSYNTAPQKYAAGQWITSRSAILYANIDKATTANLASDLKSPSCAEGWTALIVKDPDGRRFLVAANLNGSDAQGGRTDIVASYKEGAPVLTREMVVNGAVGKTDLKGASATAQLQEIRSYIAASGGILKAVQGVAPDEVYIMNPGKSAVTAIVNIWTITNRNAGGKAEKVIGPGGSYRARVLKNAIVFEAAPYPGNYRKCSEGSYVFATTHTGEHLPFNAADGDVNTTWISEGPAAPTTPQSVTMDLLSSYMINKIILSSNANSGPRKVSVEVSADGKSYVSVPKLTTVLLRNTATPQSINFAEVSARFVRINIAESYSKNNTQINELEVYGQ